jgi:hypothetical protein
VTTLRKIIGFEEFEIKNKDEFKVGNITYEGKEDYSGKWFITKIDESTNITITYASSKNNATYTSYSLAWADKLILTYGTHSNTF